eukprot:14149288-Heterocapsa_arctica.AAC.1
MCIRDSSRPPAQGGRGRGAIENHKAKQALGDWGSGICGTCGGFGFWGKGIGVGFWRDWSSGGIGALDGGICFFGVLGSWDRTRSDLH